MTRIVSSVLVAVALVWSGQSTLQGQEPMAAGSTVRLTLVDSDTPLTGVLLFMTDDAWGLTLPDGEVLGIDPASVTGAEVQVLRNSLPATLIGGGIGLASGLLVVAVADEDCGSDLGSLCDLSVGAVVVGGAAVGALFGRLIGSTRWVPAVIPNESGTTVAFRWSLQTGR
jgi:hypothetical protein